MAVYALYIAFLANICYNISKGWCLMMVYRFGTTEFQLDYTESCIRQSVLWESHCHAQFEMIAVVEGDITVMREGKNYRLTENQIIIIPPLSYHTVTANQQGTYRRIAVLFDFSAIPPVLRSEFALRGMDSVVSVFPYAEQLREIYQKGDLEFYAPLVHSLMTRIFYDVLEQPENPSENETDAFLKKVLQYIDEHLQEKILLDDLAVYTARSKSSLCHLFENKMGISPKQYILKKKLALASKMIYEGIPPTVAAAHIGYENYSNFYRLYKKNIGQNPAKK